VSQNSSGVSNPGVMIFPLLDFAIPSG
jgi:hypothetical protein